MRVSTIAVLAALLLPSSAFAAENGRAPACTNPNTPLPESIAGWAKAAMPMDTAHTIADAQKTPLPLGERVTLTLAQTDTIIFAHQPSEQMPKEYVYSGMMAFPVPKDGKYSVMIAEANWVDVVQNGAVVQSLDMGPRIPCIRYGKKLEFPLKAGTATVQFFGAPYDKVDVMVAPAP